MQELYANNAFTTLAGTSQPWAAAPAPGTVEVWQVASSAAPLPQAVNGVSQWRGVISPVVADTNPEIVIVGVATDGTHLTVTRGAEGSTVKAHAAGHQLTCVLTKGNLPSGSIAPPVALTGTDPATVPLTVQSADVQVADILAVRTGLIRATADTDAPSANAGIRYTAVTPGAAGNAITVTVANPFPPAQPLTVAVVGSAVTINLAVDGAGTVLSTANDVIVVIAATPAAAALIVASLMPGNDGTALADPKSPFLLHDGADDTLVLVVDSRGLLHLHQATLNDKLLVLQGVPGSTFQSTTLLQINDDTGTPVADWDAGGHMEFYDLSKSSNVSIDKSGWIRIFPDLTQSPGSPVLTMNTAGFQVVTPGSGLATTISSETTGDVALRLGPRDATSDALQVLGDPDYTGREFRVWGTGMFSTAVHAAPADGDLVAGELAFWFDDTNGAAKMMLKGKQADGTVVTGNVTLT